MSTQANTLRDQERFYAELYRQITQWGIGSVVGDIAKIINNAQIPSHAEDIGAVEDLLNTLRPLKFDSPDGEV